jgi:hypothetical protein
MVSSQSIGEWVYVVAVVLAGEVGWAIIWSMANADEFVARGKVTSAEGGKVVFEPAGTNYRLTLDGEYAGKLNVPVGLIIRLTGRKILTVPSGGQFVAPIYGPPKTIQGRVRYADEKMVVVHAGCVFHIALPVENSAIDLNNGAIAVNTLVNAICMPGATFEVAKEVVAV